MSHFNLFCLIFIIIQLFGFVPMFLAQFPSIDVEEGSEKTTISKVDVHDDVRKSIWCVTGFDELELQEGPLSEFQPYLARTATNFIVQRESKYNKFKYDYKLSLDELKYTDSQELLRRVVRNPVDMFSFQPLASPGNVCPVPQFPVIKTECKRIAPSVRVPCVQIPAQAGIRGCIKTAKGGKQCELESGTVPAYGYREDKDFYGNQKAANLHCYAVRRCREIPQQAGVTDDTPNPDSCRGTCDSSYAPKGQITNAAHLKFRAFTRRPYPLGVNKVLQSTKIEGLVIQMNHSPLGMGKAFGQFVNPEEDISCDCLNKQGIPVGCRKRTKQDIVHPSILMWHHKLLNSQLTLDRYTAYNKFRTSFNRAIKLKFLKAPTIKVGDFHGPQIEVHANLQWYFPPCTKNKIVEFLILVVHSFALQEFDLFFLGPYELPSGDSVHGRGRHAPQPFHSGFRDLMICDAVGETQNIFTQTDYYTSATYPFEYSYSYDVCIREDNTTASQNCVDPEPAACRPTHKTDSQEVFRFPRSCESPCDAVTIPPNDDSGGLVFKRSAHGGLNIITNMCLQPIAIFIGRYYKETFNKWNWKGQKLWYWLHVIGGGIASVCMYFGYFHEKWVPRTNPHTIAGNALLVCLSMTYFGSWVRHKNHYLAITAEFIHWGGGYICEMLAFWCLETAPGVSPTARTLVYTATAFLLLGYLIMEGCICNLDGKFGMRPRRRHFPTIEGRFGDLPVPGAVGRIAWLIFLTVIMLILTTICLFV